MIRYTLLGLFITWICIISWKDWFKGLCGLILLMAFIERPDMPKQMFEIPGLNPWNLAFVVVLTASIFELRKQKIRAHLPPLINFLLVYYFLFILLAFFREIGDRGGIIEFAQFRGLEPISIRGMIQEDIFNTIKYAVPGILLFYGCNSKERFKWAIWTLLAMNLLLAIQIIKVMPIGALTDGHTLEQTAIRKLDRDIGYYRSDLAIFLGGAAWAIFCARNMINALWYRLLTTIASFSTMLAVALTGGRIGLGASIVVGIVLAFYKWRRILILGPIAGLIIIMLIPSVSDRFTQGFTDEDNSNNRTEQTESLDGPNLNSVTSGRTIIWPHVINQIWTQPYFGNGRRSMQRSGLSTQLGIEYNQPFPHPHNAYLELFLDNGFVLGLPILLFYFILLRYALQMVKVTNNPICNTIGGIAIAYIVAFMVGGIGLQSFYPMQGTFSLWCAMGILIRGHMVYPPIKSTNQTTLSWDEKTDEPTLSTK